MCSSVHRCASPKCPPVLQVLPEVLQQGARVECPDAARQKEFERRIKGAPPQLSDAELRKYRSSMHLVGASLAHVPRMSLSGRRYTMEGLGLQAGELVPGARALSPQAVEVASRTYVAGVRALVYGSLLGVLGLAAAGTYAVTALDIRSGEDLRQRLQAGLGPASHALKAWITPFKLRAQEWAGDAATAAAAPDSRHSEFQRRLTDRYNPQKGAVQAVQTSEA